MTEANRLNTKLSFALLTLGIFIHIALAVYFDFTQDDAFITFRYAANFLNGDGLVYNIGEQVEGYTNFLWLIFMILGKSAGVDYVVFSRIAGIACGIGTILFTWLIGRIIFGRRSWLAGLCSFILGTILSFGYWSAAGLETAGFSMMVTGAVYFYLKRSYLTPVFLIPATLLRPEGGLVMGIIIFHNVISTKSLSGYALVISSIYTILLLPFAIFKWTYFHALLPNPFYAKTGFDLTQLYNGLEYTGSFIWHYLAGGLFIAPFLLAFRKWPLSIRTIALFLLVYTLYIVLVGGDVLKVHRFFVPLFPSLIIITIYGFNKLTGNRILFLGGLVLLLGWQLYIPFDHVKTYHLAEKALNNKMNKTIDRLLIADNSDFSMGVSTIGLVGYRLMGHTVIDLLGLTDSTIARHPEEPVPELKTTWKEESYNSRYVLSRQPDYILFSTEFKPSAPAEQALFLYSQFLNSYRTIGFYFDGTLHTLFKRYYPIEGEITRNVDPAFVQTYYRAIEIWGDKRFDESIIEFYKAISICPDLKFPYPRYFIADANRELYNLETAYNMLKKLVSTDTLVFEAYKDLYIFEYAINNNLEMAKYYRNKIAQLAPWYVPRLESLARSVRQTLIYDPKAGAGE